MVDLGFLYMMFLKDYPQYEKQKKGKSRESERQVSREAGKAEKHGKAEKQKAEKQRSRETEIQKNICPKRKKIIPKKNNPPNKMVPVIVCLVVVSGLFIPRSKFVV